MIDIKELIRNFDLKKGLIWIILSGMIKDKKKKKISLFTISPNY